MYRGKCFSSNEQCFLFKYTLYFTNRKSNLECITCYLYLLRYFYRQNRKQKWSICFWILAHHPHQQLWREHESIFYPNITVRVHSVTVGMSCIRCYISNVRSMHSSTPGVRTNLFSFSHLNALYVYISWFTITSQQHAPVPVQRWFIKARSWMVYSYNIDVFMWHNVYIYICTTLLYSCDIKCIQISAPHWCIHVT